MDVCYDAQRKCLLKMGKYNNPKMLSVYFIIRREIIESKNIPPVFNKILEAIRKCISAIKMNAKSENPFQIFCENKNVNPITILFHTEMSWHIITKLI